MSASWSGGREGWPAGLYLAALSAADRWSRSQGSVAALTGNDPFVVDFLRSEFLAHLPPHELRFLSPNERVRAAVGPVLRRRPRGRSGSAEMLESLAESNRFVVGLDRDQASGTGAIPLVREVC